MKSLVLLFALTLPAITAAADFRQFNFGDNCDDIITYEQSQGSELVQHHLDGYIFKGHYPDQQTTIHYQCSNNQLSRGTYQFEFDNFDQAINFFMAQKANFLMDYGLPSSDQNSQTYQQQLQAAGFEMREEHKYLITWEQQQRTVLLAAGPASASKPQPWVSVDITPLAMENDHHHH